MNPLRPLALSLFLTPLAFAANGGPDAYGYTWTDSNETNGPNYSWLDISATGTEVLTTSSPDPRAETITLARPWGGIYGQAVSQLQASRNGYLSDLLSGSGNDETNDCPLPAVPSAGGNGFRINPLHDHIELDSSSGQILYQYLPDSPHSHATCGVHVITWKDVYLVGQSSNLFSFQTLLFDNLDILFQYAPGNPDKGASSTTGIQNASATIGLNVACNTANSIPDNYAVLITPPILTVTTEDDELDSPAGPELSLREAIRDATSGTRIEFDTSFNSPVISGPNINLASSAGGQGSRIDIDAKVLAIDASMLDVPAALSGNNDSTRHGFIENGAWAFFQKIRFEEGNANSTLAGSHQVLGSSTLLAYDCQWADNFSNLDCGAILVTGNSRACFTRCDFFRNTTNSTAGAIAVRDGATLDANFCRFYRNQAGIDGSGNAGAIQLTEATANFDQCEFALNSSSGVAGALLGNVDSVINARACTFDNNRANNGGAFVAENSTTVSGTPCIGIFERCTFSQNVAATGGGAVYENSATNSSLTADLSFRYSTFLENQAGIQGGGFSIGQANIQVAAIILGYNQAFNTEDNIHLRSTGSLDPSIGDNYETGSEGNFQNNLGGSNVEFQYAPLGYYGGFVRTCIPLAGSPGVDAGQVADSAFSPGLDARQLPAYRSTQGPGLGLPDVGAVELGPIETVTSSASSGTGSLHQALSNVEAGGIIRFDSTITKLDISSLFLSSSAEYPVFIDGSLHGNVILSGADFFVTRGRQLAFHEIVFTQGENFALQESTLTNPSISANTCLTFSHCHLKHFSANSSILGLNDDTHLALLNSSISDSNSSNTLIGLNSSDRQTTLFMRDTHCDHNDSESLVNVDEGIAFIQRCSFHHNTIEDLNAAVLKLSSGASGQFISWAFLENSTISGNSVTGFDSSIRQSGIILGNTLDTFARAECEIYHSTITLNEIIAASLNATIYTTDNFANITLSNSILSNNITSAPISGNTVSSLGGNLSDLSPTIFLASDTTNTDPLLSGLVMGRNGTLHHVPRPGSPCLDSAIFREGGPTDGRGALRFLDADGNNLAFPDIGAIESGRILTITTTTDENDVSLGSGTGDSIRECLAQASNFGGVNLAVDPALTGSTFTLPDRIVLTSGFNDFIATDLTITIQNATPSVPSFSTEESATFSLHDLTFTGNNGAAFVSDTGTQTLQDCKILQSGGTLLRSDDNSRLFVNQTLIQDNDLDNSAAIVSLTNQSRALFIKTSFLRNFLPQNPNSFNALLFTPNESQATFRNCLFSENSLGDSVFRHYDTSISEYINCTVARNSGSFFLNQDSTFFLKNSIISNCSSGSLSTGTATFCSLGGNLSEYASPDFNPNLGDLACRLPYLAPPADYDGDGLPEMPPLAASPVFNQSIGSSPPPNEILIVNTTADQDDSPAGAELSLREAIRDITPGGTIVFEPSLNNAGLNLVQSSGLIFIPSTLTIDATSLPSGLNINQGTLFSNIPGNHLALHGLHLQNTSSNNSAALFCLQVPLAVSHCTVSNNAPTTLGSFFIQDAALVAENCTFSGNAPGQSPIYLRSNSSPTETARITFCSFIDNNAAAAIELDEFVLELGSCVFSNNQNGATSSSSIIADPASTFISLGYNGFPDSPSGAISTDTTNSTTLAGSSIYSNLTDNGGWVDTQLPLPLSGIEDQIPVATTSDIPPPLLDARGYPRVYAFPNSTSPGITDWGAVEIGASLQDTDADQLPDYWEWFYGFDSKSTDNSTENPDGDSANNLAEFNAGTNPLVFGNSTLPVITACYIFTDPTDLQQHFRVEWTAQIGSNYQFEISPDLTENSWTPSGSPVTATAGTNIKDFFFDPCPNEKWFYRLRLVP
ncbi:MAG: hypothetical protein AAGC74_01520 [Verrucomicrobiota bacterium]